MKRILSLIILLAAVMTLAAQSQYSPCYTEAIKAGEAAFKAQNYSKARTYFVSAKSCHGGDPAHAQSRINACDAKIRQQKEAAEAKRKAEAEAAAEAKRKAEAEAAAEAKRKAEAEAAAAPAKKEYTVNGIAFKMVQVKGGTFTMGCTSEQGGDCDSDEKPSHSVTLSDYWIGETEVTQALWLAVMGTTVSQQRDKGNSNWSLKGEGSSYPMYYVNWEEAVQFCNKLNSQLSGQLPSGWKFSLPTEAQWEYAARGGNKKSGYKYAGGNTIGDVAWYDGNSGDQTHPVKGKKPNALGLYDMSGNVWEWCSDWYTSGYYSVSPSSNPQGPSSGSYRVLRGGSWYIHARRCRVSDRYSYTPSYRYYYHGFRLVLVH